MAFNVAEGNHGDVSLDGLNFVLVLTTPGAMGEGNGTVAAYVDERANPQQRESLSSIVSGQSGGAPARFAQLFPVDNFLGIKFVPISFRKEGHQRGASIPGILEWNVEGLTGVDGNDLE